MCIRDRFNPTSSPKAVGRNAIALHDARIA
jgi:hypothetical protein